MAWGNSSVEARGNSSVEARGSVFIRLFSALKIKASAYVTIVRHGDAKAPVEGGRQLDAAPTPTTGREWCEYYGIPEDAPYKVESIDAKILADIEAGKATFDMGGWHGRKCNEDNWCGTTHCRAGFAICKAGKSGFDLEKKHGSEMAGRMIYAVSRPDLPLPNFFANDEEALADIRRCAEEESAKAK